MTILKFHGNRKSLSLFCEASLHKCLWDLFMFFGVSVVHSLLLLNPSSLLWLYRSLSAPLVTNTWAASNSQILKVKLLWTFQCIGVFRTCLLFSWVNITSGEMSGQVYNFYKKTAKCFSKVTVPIYTFTLQMWGDSHFANIWWCIFSCQSFWLGCVPLFWNTTSTVLELSSHVAQFTYTFALLILY